MSMPYLDATTIRALARELDLHPSKGRGQNFLLDANWVRKIVATAGVGAGDHVLEVGPGLGSLTVGLLHAGAAVTAVEIEPSLATRLPATMAELAPGAADRLTVLARDALTLGPGDVAAPTALVANLPYNIAVPVILHCLATYPSLARGLVMVQREVADRLAATPGSKAYGVPSVKLAWYAAATRAGTVPAAVFWPQPQIESGLVAFTGHEPPPGDRLPVFSLVDLAFSQRRKMLRAILTPAYGPGALDALAAAGVAPTARGETLTVHDFARLSGALEDHMVTAV